MTELFFEKQTAGGCVNSALFWLEGLIDGSAVTKDEIITLLANSINDLTKALNIVKNENEEEIFPDF